MKPPTVLCFVRLLAFVWTLIGTTMIQQGMAQSTLGAVGGLVVCQDPLTRYVEVFEYVACRPVNAYVTDYQLPGGTGRQVSRAAILKTIELPVADGTFFPSASQMQATVADLNALAKRYPQYATLFQAAATRWQNAPAPTSATVSTPGRPVTARAPSLASSPPGPLKPTGAITTVTGLTLKDGKRFEEVRLLHANDDSMTIRHKAGVAEILFADLPADPSALPAEIGAALKAYQEHQAVLEAEQKRVAALEAEKKRNAALEAEAKQVAMVSAPPSATSTPPTTTENLITDASSIPEGGSAGASTDVRPARRHPVLVSLMVKGLMIGMDGQMAVKSLLEQGAGKLGVIATRPPREHGYDVCLVADGQRTSGWIGHLRTDPEDETLTRFVFYGRLSDLLFNTEDQGAEAFAQTFITAYGVPKIKPTHVGRFECWACESPQGWTLRIFPDKTVEVLRTPERSFN